MGGGGAAFRALRTRRSTGPFGSNLDRPYHDGGGELLTIAWLTLEEISGLDLPLITIDALKRLQPFLAARRLPPSDFPASFQYHRGKNWIEDEIAP